MPLVLDTSVLLGGLNTDDPAHDSCRGLVDGTDEALVVPAPVLVELEYWLQRRVGGHAWLEFCERLAEGALDLFPITPPLALAAAVVQEKYHDLPLGFVDASVFVTCEALGERRVATLDRRHFSVLRTRRRKALTLLP